MVGIQTVGLFDPAGHVLLRDDGRVSQRLLRVRRKYHTDYIMLPQASTVTMLDIVTAYVRFAAKGRHLFAVKTRNTPSCVHKNMITAKEKTLEYQGFSSGGLYWTRTSDPIDVNDVLYQLSQQTISMSF